MEDDIWFSELYEHNYALLYRIGRVFFEYRTDQETLIEDQIQEAFIRAWQKRKLLKEHPNPDGWMVECYRKCMKNAFRKRIRELKYVEKSIDAEESGVIKHEDCFSTEKYMESKEQVDILFRLLGQKDAELIIRYCFCNEKAAVIAKEMNISEQALKMRVSRLKKKVLKNREMFTCLVLLLLWGIQ